MKFMPVCIIGFKIRLTTATKKAPFKFAQASQQALVLRKGNHLLIN